MIFWKQSGVLCRIAVTWRNISPSAKMLALDSDTMGLIEGVNTNMCITILCDYVEILIINKEQVCYLKKYFLILKSLN